MVQTGGIGWERRSFRAQSVVAGSNYEAVSKAYTQALHSVLTRESTAPAAAAALENELVRIMGNDKAQPGTGSH